MASKNGAPGEITSDSCPPPSGFASLIRNSLPANLSNSYRSNSPVMSDYHGPHWGHLNLARPERFELPTARFVAGYSIQLSYGRTVIPRIALHFARGANYPRETTACQLFQPVFLAVHIRSHSHSLSDNTDKTGIYSESTWSLHCNLLRREELI